MKLQNYGIEMAVTPTKAFNLSFLSLFVALGLAPAGAGTTPYPAR
jgi:hypothetical protein